MNNYQKDNKKWHSCSVQIKVAKTLKLKQKNKLIILLKVNLLMNKLRTTVIM